MIAVIQIVNSYQNHNDFRKGMKFKHCLNKYNF